VREPLDRRSGALAAWYEQLAVLVGRPVETTPRELQPPTFTPVDGDPAPVSYYGIWLCEHLSHLGDHLAELVQPARQIAEIRREPWWR
jgi:hypothetical protein